MLKYAALAVVALAGATPALAQSQFTGGHVEAIVGWDSAHNGGLSSDGVVFGIGAGYDFGVTEGTILGLEVEAADASTSKFGLSAKRDLYAGARLGAEVGPSTLLYVKGGYTNVRVGCGAGCGFTVEGIRAGAGVEHKFGPNLFGKIEYRYSNYEFGFYRHQAVAGLGYRF